MGNNETGPEGGQGQEALDGSWEESDILGVIDIPEEDIDDDVETVNDMTPDREIEAERDNTSAEDSERDGETNKNGLIPVNYDGNIKYYTPEQISKKLANASKKLVEKDQEVASIQKQILQNRLSKEVEIPRKEVNVNFDVDAAANEYVENFSLPPDKARALALADKAQLEEQANSQNQFAPVLEQLSQQVRSTQEALMDVVMDNEVQRIRSRKGFSEFSLDDPDVREIYERNPNLTLPELASVWRAEYSGENRSAKPTDTHLVNEGSAPGRTGGRSEDDRIAERKAATLLGLNPSQRKAYYGH